MGRPLRSCWGALGLHWDLSPAAQRRPAGAPRRALSPGEELGAGNWGDKRVPGLRTASAGLCPLHRLPGTRRWQRPGRRGPNGGASASAKARNERKSPAERTKALPKHSLDERGGAPDNAAGARPKHQRGPRATGSGDPGLLAPSPPPARPHLSGQEREAEGGGGEQTALVPANNGRQASLPSWHRAGG